MTAKPDQAQTFRLPAADETPSPPSTLGDRGKRYWLAVVHAYHVDPDSLETLENCCRQLDRAEQFRRAVRREGYLYKNFRGEPRVHPAVAEERAAMLAFTRITRELGLTADVPETRIPLRAGYA